jgi:acetate CoA/acetoacetate CoA-transferase alpha subunit
MEEAIQLIRSDSSLMTSGFLGVGAANQIIDRLSQSDVKGLTLIVNDTAKEGFGVGKLVGNHQVKKVIASHIGLYPEVGRQMNAGETEVELVPQGTLAERIRCGGSGLGGFYTPTGVGTEVANGKETRVIDGREYVLEKALRADVALIRGTLVDESGNVFYNATTRNFNPIVAMAADVVICQAQKLVKTGEIDPHLVMTPGILVDYIVVEEAK